MTNPLNLVMFVDLVWGGTWYSRHHLVRGLAQTNRVMIVDPPSEWREGIRRPATLFRGGRVTAGDQRVSRYAPPRWLPEFYRPEGIRRALLALRGRALRSRLKHDGLSNPIVYVWHPQFQEAAARMGDAPLVYHAYDKYDHYEGSSSLAEPEQWLAQRAALCVAPSTELANHLRSLGAKRVLELPHAVDAMLFRPGVPVAAELAAIPRPVIGVVARINEVLDIDTMHHVASTRPDWSIAFVGAALFTSDAKRQAFAALCALPNVHHFGERPRSEIPAWMNGFDVGVMCYDREAWATFAQPIKMYEYLACGLPVVSTNITATRELSRYIRLCDRVDDWIPQLEAAIREKSPAFAAPRLAFAQANSWEQRVATLEAAIRDVAG